MTMHKKTYSYVGATFIILVFSIWAIPKIVDRFIDRTDLEILGDAPQFSFTNQEGELVDNNYYRNKVYVLDFFFTSCPGICITMTKSLKTLQNAFLGNPKLGLVSITIDPKHDTPEKLKKYAEKYDAGPHWNFLTGNKSSIYDMANKGFGIYVGANAEAEGGFEHSGMLVLVDQKGKIRCCKDANGNPIFYYDGTDPKQINMLKRDITKLIN